jgi:hypothetical protein
MMPFKAIPGETIAERDPRLNLISFDDIRLGTQRRYLVKGLIPRVGLTVVWGPPKSGKSFWTFDLVMRVALGWEYRGRRTHRGPVVYCAFEGQTGIEARVEAFRQRFLAEEPDPIPFYLEPVTLDLVKDHAELIMAVQRHIAAPPVVVVLDTLNRSLRGSESSDEDMTAYIRAADAIRETFNCCVLIIHHCGVAGDRPRGHTSLSGAVDAQLSVKRDAADNIVVEVELAKDGPQGETITSRLEVVEVGVDEDDEIIASCVIVPAESESGSHQPRVTGQTAIALRLLHRAMADEGEPPPLSKYIPTSQKTVVRLETWRRFCANGIGDARTSPDTQRKTFKRAVTKLQECGLIGVWEDFCWPITNDRTNRT